MISGAAAVDTVVVVLIDVIFVRGQSPVSGLPNASREKSKTQRSTEKGDEGKRNGKLMTLSTAVSYIIISPKRN